MRRSSEPSSCGQVATRRSQQHLEGHLVAAPAVVGAIDDAHAAATQGRADVEASLVERSKLS
jgi:hypothetical protein